MSYERAARRQAQRALEIQTDMALDPRALRMMQEQQAINQQAQTMQVATICMNISVNREKFLSDAESPLAVKIVERADEILHDFLCGLKRTEEQA